MTEPTVFVELCAGLGALSLSAVAGRPIPNVWARPGGKTGYARVIWRALGLSGWRPSRIVWAEPDPACRVMLAAYSRPDVLREAAAWCRRWGAEYGEEGQRRLWEDLRGEGPPDEGAADMGREVARVGAVQRRTVSQAGARSFGGSAGDWVPTLDPRGWRQYFDDAPRDWFERQSLARWPETALHRDGREVQPIPGAVVVIDPPYLGTHGYGAGGVLPRADVVAMARRWAEAGAVVAVCEAVPVAEEMGPGWASIDITGEREGVPRGAFGGTVTEWLTLSRPAVAGWRTRGQQALFG
jgi:hypothetical protein